MQTQNTAAIDGVVPTSIAGVATTHPHQLPPSKKRTRTDATARAVRVGKTWTARLRRSGHDVYETGHKTRADAELAAAKELARRKAQGEPFGKGPKKTSFAHALRDYAKAKLPYMKGAKQEISRINFYLRLAKLPTLKVIPVDGAHVHFQVEFDEWTPERVIPNGLHAHRKQLAVKTADSMRLRAVLFEEYRGQLASRKLKEVDDAYREVAEVLGSEAEKSKPLYSAIVADETQDLGPQALRLLRALVPAGPNDLFFVGDGHQRIYSRNKAAMSRCGIDIRGRAKKLYLNYRTTDEIRRQAVALLEGCEIDDLDDGHDETKRYKSLSHGPVPTVVNVEGIEAAATHAIEFVRQWSAAQVDGVPLSFCVIASSEKSRDAIAGLIQAAGLRCVAITAQSNHADARDVVHLATMHRAKGLEFDCVMVVAPKSYLGVAEETETQRKLLYVALTRAKRGAMMLTLG